MMKKSIMNEQLIKLRKSFSETQNSIVTFAELKRVLDKHAQNITRNI